MRRVSRARDVLIRCANGELGGAGKRLIRGRRERANQLLPRSSTLGAVLTTSSARSSPILAP